MTRRLVDETVERRKTQYRQTAWDARGGFFFIRLVLLLLSLRMKVNAIKTETRSKEVKLFSQP